MFAPFFLAGQHGSNSSLKQKAELGAALYLSSPDSSISLGEKLLEEAISANDKYYQGYAFYVLSKAYWVKANYRLSTEYGFKALRHFEDSQYKNEWVLSLLSVARTLADLGNMESANELISKGIHISGQQSNDTLLAQCLREKSFVLMQKNQLDSALVYAERGIGLFRKLGDSLDVSILYGRKSVIFFREKDYKRSKHFANLGIELDKIVGNMRALAVGYYVVAQNELALKNLEDARNLLDQSIAINARIGNLSMLSKANELLASVFIEQHEPEKAAFHFQKAGALKDSLFRVERNGQIQEMEALYELGEKENTIKLLEREDELHHQEAKTQRLFLVALTTGILLLVLILFFVVRLRMVQMKANKILTNQNLAIELQKQELQAQAEALQRMNRLQSKLFSVISHDLRGPIGNLQGVLELFTRKKLSESEMVELSNRLRKNLNVTQRTLENLLNWALSQMDGIKTEKKRVAVESIINEACDVMNEAAERKRIILSKSIDASIDVLVDSDQIHLVLRNLIHNAIKFSKIGDTIIVHASRGDSTCHIRVIDTGIGTTSEEIEIILASTDHFTKEGTQQEKGTGLGLLLCKEFIERNGGDFEFKSKLGKGTEVSFTLTLA